MFSRLMFSTMVTLSTIASAALINSPDSTWLSGDDNTLFSNIDLMTLDPAAPIIPFNQALFPSDSEASLFGSSPLPQEISLSSFTTNNDIGTISDALLWDLDGSSSDIGISNLPWSGATDDNNNESNSLFLDDHFQLADCSAPSQEQSLSALDNTLAKSRLRRRDEGSNRCTNPAVTPHTNSQSSTSAADDDNLKRIRTLLADPDFRAMAAEANKNPNFNFPCFILTDGKLPWGVCSSGQENDQSPLDGGVLIDDAQLPLWSLRQAILGKTFPFLFCVCLLFSLFFLLLKIAFNDDFSFFFLSFQYTYVFNCLTRSQRDVVDWLNMIYIYIEPGMFLSCPVSPPQVFHCCAEFQFGIGQACVKFSDLVFHFM